MPNGFTAGRFAIHYKYLNPTLKRTEMKEDYILPGIRCLGIRAENGFAVTHTTEQMDSQEEDW